MDLTKLKKIYMIGIKGVGMTMLGQYLAAKGVHVSGSDTEEKFMTDETLKRAGIRVVENFSKNNIPADVDLIIYSSAYNAENNAEVAAAVSGRVKTMTYAEALGCVFNRSYGIAVVGTHGKTTTSAWLGYVMHKARLQPSVMVGACVRQFDGCSIVGKSDYIVAEMDEYQNKLRYYQPKTVLLNNIEYDHPDFFPTFEEYKDVFIEFIKKIPSRGLLVANYDDPVIRKIAQVNCRGRVATYAIDEEADYVAYEIKQAGDRQYFKVKLGAGEFDEEDDAGMSGGDIGDFCIRLSGRHNVYNALAVIAACAEMDIDLAVIREHLGEFEGTARRMQVLGTFRGATVIDDYAHHPTEIKATLAGARERYPDNRLSVVFHPHTYTRTKALLGDFARSFGEADEVIVLDIYGSAREKHGGVHSRDLVRALKHENMRTREQNVVYIPTLEECETYLREHIERGDVVLLMGAGNVFRVGERLVQN